MCMQECASYLSQQPGEQETFVPEWSKARNDRRCPQQPSNLIYRGIAGRDADIARVKMAGCEELTDLSDKLHIDGRRMLVLRVRA